MQAGPAGRVGSTRQSGKSPYPPIVPLPPPPLNAEFWEKFDLICLLFSPTAGCVVPRVLPTASSEDVKGERESLTHSCEHTTALFGGEKERTLASDQRIPRDFEKSGSKRVIHM